MFKPYNSVVQDSAGYFCDINKLSKYYLTCLSYVPVEKQMLLKELRQNEQMTSEVICDENRQALQKTFENICLGKASSTDRTIAKSYMNAQSLESLVKDIIPKEFDSVYTVCQNYSLLEVNKLIRSLGLILTDKEKAKVITAYLNYRMDDVRIRRSMPGMSLSKSGVRQKTIVK